MFVSKCMNHLLFTHPGEDFIVILMLSDTRMFHLSTDIELSLKFSFVQRIFLLSFLEDISLFVGPLIPLFWTSGDVCPVFQNYGGSHATMLPHLGSMDSSDFTAGLTPAVPWQPA